MPLPEERRWALMNELYQRLAAYQAAMALARSMLRKGIISQEDYRKIDTIIANKHGISSCTIFRFECLK